MRTALSIFVGLLFVALFSDAQVAGANLRDTLQWMKDTTPNHTSVWGTIYYTLRWDYGNPSQCDIKATVTTHEVAGHDVYENDSIFTFSLKDIDPKSIFVAYGFAGSDTEMMFETKNEMPKLACETVIKTKGEYYGKKWREAYGNDLCYSGEPLSSEFNFTFQSASYAKRFAKALRHAVLLCGGTPSPF